MEVQAKMGIQENAGKIFYLMYQMYLKDESINPQRLLEITNMEGKDIDRAIKYLKDKYLIDIILTLGNHQGVQHFILKKITPDGINVAEDDTEFIRTFKINPKEIRWEGYC